MSSRTPETGPGRAEAVDGLVILDGPKGVALTMTAAAARETANRLREAADRAEGQRGIERG